MHRYLLDPILEDLKTKMVFLHGPRQVGKTFLGKQVLEQVSPEDPVYLNWDRPEHRKTIRELGWSRACPVAVLDEVHKYARWKTLVKGFFDTEGERQRLLITGSARLDLYRRGGDSLVGRYRGFRLHPLSLGELFREGGPPALEPLLDPDSWPRQKPAPVDALDSMLALGCFPEPLLSGNERTARRWRLARHEQVLKQDLRDLSMVREVSQVEHLVAMLAERVASTISVNALREDLQVGHATVSSWIDLLERLQVVFRVPPYSGSLARTLRKESKVYFRDASDAPAGGARFENLVACHLLKLCHWLVDVQGIRCELFFVRDRDGREVDFLLVKERAPWVLVEAKESETKLNPSLRYFQERLNAPHAFQVTRHDRMAAGIVPARRLLAVLP